MPQASAPAIDRRWIILAALFVARSAMGFQFQSVATSAPSMIAALGVGYTEIGTLIGLYMLPGVMLALPGGLLVGRFGDRVICSAGLVLMVLGGALMGVAPGYGVAAFGRFASGVGGVLFTLVLTKMATDWFAGREIVFAMAIVLASWPFGIALGLVVQVPLATAFDWRSVMLVAAGLCVGSLILLRVVYAPPPGAALTGPAGGLVLPPLRASFAAGIAGLIWGAFNVGLVLFFSFVPTLLVEQGATPLAAASNVSLALWVSMVSLSVAGYLVQRFGRADAAIVLFGLACALVLGLFAGAAAPAAVLSISFGLAIGPPPGAIMALPARVLAPAERASGLGLLYAVYYLAMAIGPPIAGGLQDRFGTAAAAVLFGAALFVAVAVLLPAFRLAGGATSR